MNKGHMTKNDIYDKIYPFFSFCDFSNEALSDHHQFSKNDQSQSMVLSIILNIYVLIENATIITPSSISMWFMFLTIDITHQVPRLKTQNNHNQYISAKTQYQPYLLRYPFPYNTLSMIGLLQQISKYTKPLMAILVSAQLHSTNNL